MARMKRLRRSATKALLLSATFELAGSSLYDFSCRPHMSHIVQLCQRIFF